MLSFPSQTYYPPSPDSRIQLGLGVAPQRPGGNLSAASVVTSGFVCGTGWGVGVQGLGRWLEV